MPEKHTSIGRSAFSFGSDMQSTCLITIAVKDDAKINGNSGSRKILSLKAEIDITKLGNQFTEGYRRLTNKEIRSIWKNVYAVYSSTSRDISTNSSSAN